MSGKFRFARRLAIVAGVCGMATAMMGTGMASAEPAAPPVYGAGTFTGLVTTPPGPVSVDCTPPTGPYTFSGIQISGATVEPTGSPTNTALGPRYVGSSNVTGVAGTTTTTDDSEAFDAIPAPVGCGNTGTASTLSGDGSVDSASSPFSCAAGTSAPVVSSGKFDCKLWGDFTRLGNVVLVDLTGCIHVDPAAPACTATSAALGAGNAGILIAASLTADPTGITVPPVPPTVNLYDITGGFIVTGPASAPGP